MFRRDLDTKKERMDAFIKSTDKKCIEKIQFLSNLRIYMKIILIQNQKQNFYMSENKLMEKINIEQHE